MPAELRLSFRQRLHPEGVINAVDVIESAGDGRVVSRVTVDFQHIDRQMIPEPRVLDGYLFCFLLPALSAVERLVIEGALSATAVRNANLLSEAWRCWLPDRYRPIEIVAESISDDRSGRQHRKTDSAIAAFSGGIDATFTALRHAGRTLGSASFPINDLVMVHGFDVSEERANDFRELVERTRPFVEMLGVQLHAVRTNIRRVSDYDWEHAHGARVACVLHQFSAQHRYGLIASTLPISEHTVTWGSTPSSDHFLSGDDLLIVHDGAGFTRTEKVELIARNPIASASVKFCWEGDHQGRNCGVCVKCVMTRLNFLAVGVTDPTCFDTPFDMSMIDGLEPHNETERAQLQSILDYATRHSRIEEWTIRLDNRLRALNAGRPHLTSSQLEERPIPPGAFQRRLLLHQDAVCAVLRDRQPVILLTEIPGNIGDHLIWAGGRHLLENGGIAYEELPLRDLESLRTRPFPGTLVVPGSAAFTSLFHEWLPQTIITASQAFERVVILPSEFDPAVPEVHTALSRGNVYAFAREAHSYKTIKHYGRASLALDPALWAHDFIPAPPGVTASEIFGEVLLALRTDEASDLRQRGLQFTSENDDISLTTSLLTDFLKRVGQADTVVTDRLHIGVAAIMLGKMLHYVDPLNAKISRYISYNFRDEFAEQICQHDVAWLLSHGFVSMGESGQ